MSTTITPSMTAPAIDELALHALRAALQGQLYTPDDGGYDAARTPWQLHVEQRPAAIVMAASAASTATSHRHTNSGL